MCGDVYVTGYVPSDVDRSVLNKVLMVPVHLKHWLPQVEEKNSEACALPDSASSFSNYVVLDAQILVFLEELEEEAWA